MEDILSSGPDECLQNSVYGSSDSIKRQVYCSQYQRAGYHINSPVSCDGFHY